MNRVMIDPSAESPRVIIVERRSLLSQVGGVWFVALPIIATYLICRVPYDVPEASVAELRLGDNDWQYPEAPKVAAPANPAAVPALPNPASPVHVEPAATTDVAAEAPAPIQPMPVEPPVQGVVVLDSPKANVNPVAVFDPDGKAPAENSEAEKPGPLNRTLEAALNFDGGQPSKDETRQALAEINAAADKAREERERAESLKPLVAIHEQAQAKVRETRRADAERRRVAESREDFLQQLGAVLASDSSITQQGRQIDLLVRRVADQVNAAPFESVFKRVANVRASRASKLRYLIQQQVPEALVLSYLIDLDTRDIGKSGGPRDKDHAIVRSAEFLLSNVKAN